MNRNVIRKIPAIIVMLGIFILSSLPGNDPFLGAFEFNDKIKHIIAYFVLGIAFCMWIPRKKWLAKPFVYGMIVILASAVFGISDEFHQSFVPGRSGNDIGDIAADFIGGFFAPFFYFSIFVLNGWRVAAVLKRRKVRAS